MGVLHMTREATWFCVLLSLLCASQHQATSTTIPQQPSRDTILASLPTLAQLDHSDPREDNPNDYIFAHPPNTNTNTNNAVKQGHRAKRRKDGYGQVLVQQARDEAGRGVPVAVAVQNDSLASGGGLDSPSEMRRCRPRPLPTEWARDHEQLSPDQLFFSFWTTEASTFRARFHRSIESVMFHHPQATMVVYSNSLPATHFSTLRDLGCDVRVEPIRLKEMAQHTRLSEWTEHLETWKRFPFFYAHLADALRLAALHQHGGTYLDTDVIVMRDVSRVRNVVGLEDELGDWGDEKICNAVMKFESNNEYIAACIEEFVAHYQPDNWDANGPVLLTRVWNNQFRETNPYPASNNNNNPTVTVLSRDAFYAINWRTVDQYFAPSLAPLVTRDLAWLQHHALAVHFWNKMSGGLVVGEGSLIGHVMDEFCLQCDLEVD